MLQLLTTACFILVTAYVALCQKITYIDDIIPSCFSTTPETVCGDNDGYMLTSSFMFSTNEDYSSSCDIVRNNTAMYGVYSDMNYIRDMTIVVPYTKEGCKVYTNILLRSVAKYSEYICPSSITSLTILSAKMEAVAKSTKLNVTYFFCNGTFVPGIYNNMNKTVTKVQDFQSTQDKCRNFVDLSASGAGWNSWFENSEYATMALSLGLSTYIQALKSKQWQTACLALNGSISMDENDVKKGNLVQSQMRSIVNGNVPSEQKSTTRAQYYQYSNSGKVEQLVLYSDSICTYNEVGKCLTQTRYYCQPNATSIQNSGESIYYDVPNSCFFQMRTRNAGPGNSSQNPLFSTGSGEMSSGSSFLENSQHAIDWEDHNTIYTIDNGEYIQLSMLPSNYKLCSNYSLSTATPFYNKLFGISNLRVIAKNPDLCILGNTTSIFPGITCVNNLNNRTGQVLLNQDIDTQTQISSVDTSTCFNTTSSVWCDNNSQIVVMGAHLDVPRYDCGLEEINCADSTYYSPPYINETCYSWYVSGSDGGTYEITNSSDIRNYYSPINITSENDIFQAYALSDLYPGYGDGVLCGQQRDMMLAAAKCFRNCFFNLTANYMGGQRPCNLNTRVFGTVFDGSHCESMFNKYSRTYNQLGVPVQNTFVDLVGTLSSSSLGIFNKDIDNLGAIQNVDTPVTSGKIIGGNVVQPGTAPDIKLSQPLPNKYQDGYCYIPLSAISGYKQAYSGDNVNLPVAQGISQFQASANEAQFAAKLQSSIQSLKNNAQQETPPVDLATIILTITSCLGALTGVKILEIYVLLHRVPQVIQNKHFVLVTRSLFIVITTVTITAFAIAPAIAMFVQDQIARRTYYSTTYGAYIQNDIYLSQVSTLSIVSVIVSYVQSTPYGKAVDAVFYVIVVLSILWWLYATVSIFRKRPLKP